MSAINDESSIAIAEGALFALLSCASGTAYILQCKEESLSYHVEGDDVPGFLKDYEAIKAQYPAYDADQTLAQLWDQGGYSWMAVPDET